MLSDLERVKAAMRAGAMPQLVFGTDNLTRRCLKPDTIVHGPGGDVLVLVRYGRVTMLGRLWDLERDVQSGLRVQNKEEPMGADSKKG